MADPDSAVTPLGSKDEGESRRKPAVTGSLLLQRSTPATELPLTCSRSLLLLLLFYMHKTANFSKCCGETGAVVNSPRWQTNASETFGDTESFVESCSTFLSATHPCMCEKGEKTAHKECKERGVMSRSD